MRSLKWPLPAKKGILAPERWLGSPAAAAMAAAAAGGTVVAVILGVFAIRDGLIRFRQEIAAGSFIYFRQSDVVILNSPAG